MPCFPCQTGQTAHRKCTGSIENRHPMIVAHNQLVKEPLSGTIERLKLLEVPISKTHSMLFTTLGTCLVNTTAISTRQCQPECFPAIGTPDMCNQPLGTLTTNTSCQRASCLRFIASCQRSLCQRAFANEPLPTSLCQRMLKIYCLLPTNPLPTNA
jgi:hypothetical protein